MPIGMRLRGFAIVLAVLFAVGCTSGGSAGPAPTQTAGTASGTPAPAQPVKFAVLTILTGTAQALGEQHLRGVQMAVDDINAAGGVNGSKIQLDVQDSALDRTVTVALVRKAAADKSILAINGPLSTPEIIAAAPVCGEVQIVCHAAGSTAPWSGQFNDYTFRSNLISVIALPEVLKTVKSKLNTKSIAVIYDITNECSVGETNQLKDTIAKSLGLDVAAVEGYRQTDTDFTPQLTNILAKKPDLMYVTGIADQAALIIQQARQRGYTGEFLGGCSDLNDAKIYQSSGGAAKNAITFSAFNKDDSRKIVQDFIKRYKDKFKEEPSNFVTAGHDSVLLFADATKRAKTTTDRKAFRDALGSTTALEGLNGMYTYKKSGDNQTPGFTIFRIKEGGGYLPF